MNLSHAQQQKLLADNRRRENAREDQVKRINQERMLEANMASEERIENKRFLRRLHQEATEKEMDEGIRKVKASYFIDLNTQAFLFLFIWAKISTCRYNDGRYEWVIEQAWGQDHWIPVLAKLFSASL